MTKKSVVSKMNTQTKTQAANKTKSHVNIFRHPHGAAPVFVDWQEGQEGSEARTRDASQFL